MPNFISRPKHEFTALDELVFRHPLPWTVDYEILDADGKEMGSLDDVKVISDAMQELFRLRKLYAQALYDYEVACNS